MPYRIAHDEATGIVEVTYTGRVTKADFAAASAAAYEFQKSHGILRFLIEIAESAEMAATKVDIYNLPSKAYAQFGLDRRTRIAMLVPGTEALQQAAAFYEDASRNRGWNVRSFPGRSAAMAWLKQKV